MLILLILLTFCDSYSVSFIIDYASTKMITFNQSSAYFGYSVILQKGNPPLAIVGAPRMKHGDQNAGSVFKCNLNTLHCNEYNEISKMKGTYPFNKNGAFLGSVLDGDDITGRNFFTCAPRFIQETTRGDYFTNGRCFLIKNSSNVYENPKLFLPLSTEKQVAIIPQTVYYDAAYAEAGLSMTYIKDQNSIFVGAPGKALWGGGAVRTSIISYTNSPYFLEKNLLKYQNTYFGYAVTWGKFLRSQRIWYVSGGPRDNDLRGSVIFYDQGGYLLKMQLSGEQYGSYFGSSLLVIHKIDGDDLLVGAPMYSGNTWDEGCVYYYQNKHDGTFYPPVKLSSKKSFARFGTSMSNIGDIDLDSFTDCAISAPYEDNGVGAVYIYFGMKTGFSDDNFHRISPSHFSTIYPHAVVRGFGMGLSNGNDIDNNKHNDLVIGAYQSGQIFYLKTKQLFDVSMNVTSNLKLLFTSTTNFSLTYCIRFKFRNGDNDKKLSLLTRLMLDDDRILNRQNISKDITTKASETHCFNEMVYIKKDHLNIEPFFIRYGYKLYNTENSFIENTLTVPVSYECGTDNVCQTNLSIKSTTFDKTRIIFGTNSEVKVNVTITNSGESAYQTKLYLKVSPEISLINLRECDLENGSYVCLVAQVLHDKVEKSFLFDLANIPPSWMTIPIKFKVESIGRDIDPSDNEVQIFIPVVLQTNSHIDSRSVPENVFINKSEQILKISHSFLVGNYGPSPLDLNLTILVPQVEINESRMIEIKSIEGSVNGISSECKLSNKKLDNIALLAKLQQENNSKIISCIESAQHCTYFTCVGGYLPKSNKNAVFTLKLFVHINSAVKFLEQTNKLILISSAYYTNQTNEFFSSAITAIYKVRDDSKIPVWIYLASIVSGLILLLLIIFSLYKCNFFKRNYKELMDLPVDQSEDSREQHQKEMQENKLQES